MSDAKMPSVHYTVISADGCERTTSYGADGCRYEVYHDTGWCPREPELQTAKAEIEIYWSASRHETLQLDGDQHRDMEMYDRLPDLLDAIASGDVPQLALEEVLSGAAQLAMAC